MEDKIDQAVNAIIDSIDFNKLEQILFHKQRVETLTGHKMCLRIKENEGQLDYTLERNTQND